MDSLGRLTKFIFGALLMFEVVELQSTSTFLHCNHLLLVKYQGISMFHIRLLTSASPEAIKYQHAKKITNS